MSGRRDDDTLLLREIIVATNDKVSNLWKLVVKIRLHEFNIKTTYILERLCKSLERIQDRERLRLDLNGILIKGLVPRD